MILRFDNKGIRARVIADYLRRARRFDAGGVCFTCGNAARALVGEGLYVVEVGARGGLTPSRWWSPAEIAAAFPGLFDATSGHLSVGLMAEVGQAFRRVLGPLRGDVVVPSGSGETFCSLALAYGAEARLIPVYDDLLPETTFSPEAPLNPLVRLLSGTSGLPPVFLPQSMRQGLCQSVGRNAGS